MKSLRTSFLKEHLRWLLLYSCKSHLYRLKILQTIPLDCNIIPCHFQLIFVFFFRYICLRSSRQEVLCEKGVLRNFTKSTRKHLCQVSFLIKLQTWPVTLLKKRLWHRCFPVNFVKFLRTSFLTEHLWCLLLMFAKRLLLMVVKGMKVKMMMRVIMKV